MMRYLIRTMMVIGAVVLFGLTVWLMVLRADTPEKMLLTFISTRTGQPEIYVMSEDGVELRQFYNLVIRPYSYSWHLYPRWHEEKHCILFAPRESERQCVDLLGRKIPVENPSVIDPGIQHQFNPIRNRAVIKDDGNWHVLSAADRGLFRIRNDGTGLVQLSSFEASHIVYLEESDDVFFITADSSYIVSFDGLGHFRIGDTMVRLDTVSPSPNHKWIVRIGNDPRGIGHFVGYDYEVVNRKSLDKYTEMRSYIAPIWSPDSRYLVYVGVDGLQVFDCSAVEKLDKNHRTNKRGLGGLAQASSSNSSGVL